MAVSLVTPWVFRASSLHRIGYPQSSSGHWNAECVGWHVCKVGSRFAALDPIAQGLERLYGSLDADVARGLALRMDHGSQYLVLPSSSVVTPRPAWT